MLNTSVQMPMITTSVAEPSATVSRNAMPVEMNPPMYGMKHRKNDRTNTGRANGMPSTTMITSWLAAPTNEIAAVPNM